MVQKMTLPQMVEFLEFGQRWHLPDTETKRRMILIADRITENKFIYHLSDGYFKTGKIKILVDYANGMAGLRPITDEMLMNYIDGLPIIRLYFKYKKKQDEEEFNRLVCPAFNIQTEYFSQEQWIDFLIDSKVAGDEKFKINGMKIPFSHEAIKIFLRDKGTKSLFPSHFPKVKSDFHKYNIEIYGDKTPIDTNSVKDKDNKLIITSSAKDNEIDYTELLKALSKYLSGIKAVEFTNIIEHHPLTTGTPKAKWNGIPADAARFADHLNISFSDFNKLIEFKDIPKLLPNHRQKVRESGECTTSEINAILEKFIPK